MKLLKSDRCIKAGCKNEWEINYLGDKICQRCFDKICAEQDKKNKKNMEENKNEMPKM